MATSTTPVVLPANFFAQLLTRLFSNKPWFFKVIQVAAGVLGVASTVIQIIGTNNITLPSYLAWIPTLVTQVAAIVAIVISQLPVSNPVVTPAK
jgi:hypothetical protein